MQEKKLYMWKTQPIISNTGQLSVPGKKPLLPGRVFFLCPGSDVRRDLGVLAMPPPGYWKKIILSWMEPGHLPVGDVL